MARVSPGLEPGATLDSSGGESRCRFPRAPERGSMGVFGCSRCFVRHPLMVSERAGPKYSQRACHALALRTKSATKAAHRAREKRSGAVMASTLQRKGLLAPLLNTPGTCNSVHQNMAGCPGPCIPMAYNLRECFKQKWLHLWGELPCKTLM